MLNKMSDDELCETLQVEMLSQPADIRKLDISTPILIERHYALMDSYDNLNKEHDKLKGDNTILADEIKFVKQDKKRIEKEHSKLKESFEILRSLMVDDPELEDNSVNSKIKKRFRLHWKQNYCRPAKDEQLNKAAEVAIDQTLREYGINGEDDG
jgi:predicted  nucleic acid-binding Zn-ribbon protein